HRADEAARRQGIDCRAALRSLRGADRKMRDLRWRTGAAQQRRCGPVVPVDRAPGGELAGGSRCDARGIDRGHAGCRAQRACGGCDGSDGGGPMTAAAIRRWAADKRLPEPALARWLALEEPARAALLALASELRLRTAQLATALELVDEIA